jgi:hypothetical protein
MGSGTFHGQLHHRGMTETSDKKLWSLGSDAWNAPQHHERERHKWTRTAKMDTREPEGMATLTLGGETRRMARSVSLGVGSRWLGACDEEGNKS